MAAVFNLQRLLEITSSETELAASSLGDLNRQLKSQEHKLSLLLQYRADYQQRLCGAIANGLNSAGLRNFNDFMARLEQAIRQQQTAVDDARGRAEHGRRHWQEKQRKSKAFDMLSKRFTATLMRGEMRVEQKLQDDFANRTPCHKAMSNR